MGAQQPGTQVNVNSRDSRHTGIVLGLIVLGVVALAVVGVVAVNGWGAGGNTAGGASLPSAAVSLTPSAVSASPTASGTPVPALGTPEATTSATKAAATSRPTPSCSVEHPADLPAVTQTVCYLLDGDNLYMVAFVKASTPTQATVYMWLTAGDVYAYPAKGPYAFPVTTLGTTAKEFRQLVEMPLTHGTTYSVHISTKAPGSPAPNAVNNPAVTGYSMSVAY
ncbi:hypothetical protein [Kitasatospora sp. NPDC059327]|uniref:hypothetical protein n=1 Tax=Kitasatospora sp. NPDC059327 TaxID=3346803 RepID=UPI003694B634